MFALTVDVEQFNCASLRGGEDNCDPCEYSKEGVDILLKLLKEHQKKATFFVTSFFAEKEKKSVKKIHKGGHEVASHGFNHHWRGVQAIDYEKEIIESKKILEDLIGEKVLGFRAPQVQYRLPAVKICDEAGYTYDSSLHPAFVPGYYNFLDRPLSPFKPFPHLKIKEIPCAVIPYVRQPVSWMWLRLLGVWWTKLGANMLLRNKITPVIYIHPWEMVEVKCEGLPWYITSKTGKPFQEKIEQLMKVYKEQKFVLMRNIPLNH